MNLNKFLCLSWSRKALVPSGKEAAEFSIYGEQNPRFNTLLFKNLQQACPITQQQNVPKYDYNDSYFLSLFKAHCITVVCHVTVCLFFERNSYLIIYSPSCQNPCAVIFSSGAQNKSFWRIFTEYISIQWWFHSHWENN